MAEGDLPLIQLPLEEMERSYNAEELKKTEDQKEEDRNKATTAKKKNKKKDANNGKPSGPLYFLKTTNKWLEDVPMRIVKAFENFIGDGERAVQAQVDIICAWLAWKVNIAIERKRQLIFKALYDQYQKTAAGQVMKVAGAVQSFCSDPLGAIGAFASALFAPIVAVFKWITELVSEILKLAANLAKLVSALPPNPPNPHINYDKFKLKVGPVSLGAILSDPYNLPPPEVMFPEPTKPFSKEAFSKSFETASANLKSSRTMYTPSDADREALEGMGTTILGPDGTPLWQYYYDARDKYNHPASSQSIIVSKSIEAQTRNYIEPWNEN